MICIDTEKRSFTIHTNTTTYQMGLARNNILVHRYYGARVDDADFGYLVLPLVLGFSGIPGDLFPDQRYSEDALPLEYSTFGLGDYRESCLDCEYENGSRGASLRYVSHTVRTGLTVPTGLPGVYADADTGETLEILLRDSTTGLEVVLEYGVVEKYDTIVRSARICNRTGEKVILHRALSCCLDFSVPDDRDTVIFYGKHTQERTMQRTPLSHGKFRIDSTRGASSHQYNPFWMVCDRNADETHGSCWGLSFVYSGNFVAQAELDQLSQTRLVMGIHPQGFRWTLEDGEEFQTPQVILTHSAAGFDALSNNLHHLIREHLMRGPWRFRRPPVLVNNWEATYFNFDEEKLFAIAQQARDIGIEMLVMDDGWFGIRNNDWTGLGDWFVNETKLKGGLKPLVERIAGLGLKFGIWFEPEMISEDSDLFRAHPDWALTIPGRVPVRSRKQLVLDMSRADVRDYLFDAMAKILHSADISYVKWDMNRHLSDVWSAMLPSDRQGEVYHRYVLGVYDLLERVLTEFPDLLLEGCSGGGGRFDAGMLYYSPQIWCSDNTDAVSRLSIQLGTSFGYPIKSMGSHVSVCPNHGTGRTTPLKTRGDVAMMGTFGYELDLCKLSEDEKTEMRRQIEQYKQFSDLICTGDFHRLALPFGDGRCAAWMFVSPDKREALLTCVWLHVECDLHQLVLKLRGLDPDKQYYIDLKKYSLSGRTLMTAGLPIRSFKAEYPSLVYHLKAADTI